MDGSSESSVRAFLLPLHLSMDVSAPEVRASVVLDRSRLPRTGNKQRHGQHGEHLRPFTLPHEPLLAMYAATSAWMASRCRSTESPKATFEIPLLRQYSDLVVVRF